MSIKPYRILITRPIAQAQDLCAKINMRGDQALLFPTITITDAKDISGFNYAIRNLEQFNWAIFTSKHAVAKTMAHWPKFSLKIPLAAIGPGTANALLQQPHITDVIYPKNISNSEALLATPELRDLAGKKIAIFTGENPRTFLAEQLQKRRAFVTLAFAYRRIRPTISDIYKYLSTWHDIELIVSTSCESLQNLYDIIPATHREWLLNQQLLVISANMVALAYKLGFVKPVLLAANASDEAVLKILYSNKYL